MEASSRKCKRIHIWKVKRWMQNGGTGCPFGISNPCFICRALFPTLKYTKPILPDMKHRCAHNYYSSYYFRKEVSRLIEKYEEKFGEVKI
jgi:hypothetical protein